MERYCERCERVTVDGHLWCQDPECPAEEGYALLGYGDYLGDLKVTKLVRVWRTAALYEAERQGLEVLLKVAHPTDECAERLKREALLLEALAPWRSGVAAWIRSFLPSRRDVLPVPLAPYPTRMKRPYGEITFRGEPRVYSVYRHAKGKILSDVLLENPQLWHTYASWIVQTVGESLYPLVANNRMHLCLTPDMVMVEADKEGVLRPMLLDLGLLLDGSENGHLGDWLRLCEPAYSAPELLAGARPEAVSPAADVYSLGMILYEMLAGHPAFETKLRRDDQLREDVTQNRKPLALGRPELEQSGVTGIVERAVAPTGRYANVIEFTRALAKVYSSPPAEKRPIPRRLVVLLVLAAVVLLAVGILAAIILLPVLLGG